MKLHLPKMLLTAVLTACSVAWGFDGPANVTYTEASGASITGDQSPTVDTKYTDVNGAFGITVPEGGSAVDIQLSGCAQSQSASVGEYTLGTINSSSLWISNGRFAVNSSTNLSNAGDLYVSTGALQFTDTATVTNNITIGTSTFGSSWSEAKYTNIRNAALLLGVWNATNRTVALNGSLTVAESAKIAMQSGYELNATGALIGSSDLEIAYCDANGGDKSSTVTLSGDTSAYTGNITLTGDSNGGLLTLKLDGSAKNLVSTAASINVGANTVLDLTALDDQVITADFASINDNAKYSTASGGYIKVAFNHSTSAELKPDSDITLNKNIIAQGALVMHGNSGSKKLIIGEGISLIANGSSNELTGLEAINTGVIEINGGSVETSKLVLGHTSWAADYWGKLNMIDGSLKVGGIELRHDHSNVISVTGGELEFTSENVLNHWSNTNAVINILGASADEQVTLKANTANWTLDAIGTNPDNPTAVVPTTIGNVTIDADNTHDITLKNLTLVGSIVNNADLILGKGISIAASTEATLSGTGTTTITDTITNSGKVTLNSGLAIGVVSDYAVKSDGEVAYVLDASDTATTNTDGNGFMYSSGREYWLVQGGENVLGGTLSATDAAGNSYGMEVSSTEGATGIYISTGENSLDTSRYYITTGDVTIAGAGAENATGADSYVLQGGTMQITAGTVKTSEIEYTSGNVNIAAESAILQIDSADNAGGYITSTTGSAGTIDLTTSAIVDNGGTTQFGGALKVSTGGVLMLGSSNFANGDTLDWTVDVSSLDNIELAGGELKFRGDSANLGDIKVTAASTLHLYDAKQYDVGAEDNSLVTIDTLDLGANLTLSTTWKSNASIGLVTGSAADAVMTVGDCSDNRRMLTANIAHDFAGAINVNGGDAVISNLNIKASDNTTNVVTLTGMKATGEGNVNNYLKVTYSENDKTVTIARKRSADDQGTVISSVGLTDGSTLKFHGDSNQIVTTIEELNVAGNATVLANWNEGNIAITGLTGTDATLNLKSTTPTSRNTLFSLNDSETKPSSFSGVINVSTATNDGSRRTVFNLNSAEAAKDAVISLENTSTNGSGDTLALAIGADSVTVAGVKDGANNNSSKGTLMIVSGTQGIGDVNIASDSTARTLVVNTAGKDYTSSAKVSSSINLVKSGSGTQNFSGNMSSFNGTVEVSGGTLGFTKTDGAVDASKGLTLSGGKLDVTGSLTLGTVTIDLTKYTAGETIDDLVAAGNLLTGADYSVSYVDGVTTVGNFTGTVKQVDNNLVLTWSDITTNKTSLTTTISGVNGLFDSENNMLTLKIDENDSLANVGDVTISGISDDIMKQILGLDGLPGDGMVGITLRDKDGVEFTATADQMIGFQGNDGGVYYGQQVGTAWQYQAAYIPEPTTATLSLLALAGLAARRRRKA